MTKKSKASRAQRKSSRAPRATKAAPAKPVAKPSSKPKAAPAHDPIDDFIAAAAHMLALPIDPHWQPAVKMNLEVILRQAAMVTEFPLPDDTEPAPVFAA